MLDHNSDVELPCIELTDSELSTVSAGKKDTDYFLKIDGVDGD
jgi:hypothetical protein